MSIVFIKDINHLILICLIQYSENRQKLSFICGIPAMYDIIQASKGTQNNGALCLCVCVKIVTQGASEMAQQAKVHATMPENLNSMPKTYVVEAEDQLPLICPLTSHTLNKYIGIVSFLACFTRMCSVNGTKFLQQGGTEHRPAVCQ